MTATLLTGMASYFRPKCFRLFLLIFDFLIVFGLIIWSIGQSVYVSINDVPLNRCLDEGKIEPDGRIKVGAECYDNLDDCRNAVGMWYRMGFVFFFLVSTPAMLVALEIIYYWSKDPEEEAEDDPTPSVFDRNQSHMITTSSYR